MSLQIILKNSSVSGKEPTASQLANGELALNYHADGPFISCKDSAGTVRRVAGVWINTTAPTSPTPGEFWLDTNTDPAKLKIYKDGTDTWIETITIVAASTTAAGVVELATDAETQAGSLANRAVTPASLQSKISDSTTTTSSTTIASSTAVKSAKDVADAALPAAGGTISGNLTVSGDLTVNGTTTTIDTTTLIVEDKNIEMGAVGTPTDSTADGGGITLKGATDKTINWVNATDAWTSSERFDFPAGTAAAPSIILNGDVNTGIYQSAADELAISTAGTGRLFVDNSGNVGLNATPEAATGRTVLTLNGTSGDEIRLNTGGTQTMVLVAAENLGVVRAPEASGELRFDTGGTTERLRLTSTGEFEFTGAGTAGTTQAVYFSGSAPVNSLVVDSNGRTGIGTTSPAALLHLEGASPVIQLEDTDASGPYSQINGNGSGGRILLSADAGNTGTGSTIEFAVDGNVKAVIDEDGYLGVRVTDPAFPISVDGNIGLVNTGTGAAFLTTTKGGQSTYFGVDNSDGTTFSTGTGYSPVIYTGANTPICFATNGTIRTQVKADGTLYSGLSSNTIPAAHFFNGGGSAPATLLVEDDLASTTHYGLFVGADDFSDSILVTKGNRVGVGVTSPGQKFEVVASSGDNDNYAVSATMSGTATFTTAAGYFVNSDTGTGTAYGIYTSGTDYGVFSNGGDNFFQGDVGIGNSSPTYKLDLISAAGSQSILRAGQSGVSNGYVISSDGTNLTYVWNTTNSPSMTLDSSGRLGVGTTGPDGVLDAEGICYLGPQNYQVKFTSSAGNSSAILTAAQASNLELRATDTTYDQLFLASNGNIGMGSASPDQRLHLAGSVGQIIKFENTDTSLNAGDFLGEIQFEANDASAGSSGIFARILCTIPRILDGTTTNGAALNFQTATANPRTLHTSLYLDPTGQVGINSAPSGATLEVLAQGSETANVLINQSSRRISSSCLEAEGPGGTLVAYGTATGYTEGKLVLMNRGGTSRGAGMYMHTAASDGTSPVEWYAGRPYNSNDRFIISRLVGSSSIGGQTAQLINEFLRVEFNGAVLMPEVYGDTTSSAGNVHINSAGQLFRSTSSIRYKKDVETIQDSYADAILNCRPVWYKSKSELDNPDWGYWGFIAEEVAEVDPRLVNWKTEEHTYDEEGEPVSTPCEPIAEGVQYDRFVPHLVNLIKRQNERIEQLEARLAALEA